MRKLNNLGKLLLVGSSKIRNIEPFAELQLRAELSALSGEFARPSACAFGRVFP
jgi:hypothetical protein